MLTQDCFPALFGDISQLCGYRARRYTRLPAHETVDLIIDKRKRARNFLFASFLVLLDDSRQAIDITQLNVGTSLTSTAMFRGTPRSIIISGRCALATMALSTICREMMGSGVETELTIRSGQSKTSGSFSQDKTSPP